MKYPPSLLLAMICGAVLSGCAGTPSAGNAAPLPSFTQDALPEAVRVPSGHRVAGAGVPGKDATFAFEGWVLDVPKRELRSAAGATCDLTTSEFDLLKVFATHASHVLSRDQIMDLLRGHDWAPTDRSIDNLVMRLRRKIEHDPEHPRLIKSVRGVGYCFAATVSSAP